MLYDNGQLLFLYCDGWQLSKDARYLQIVEETIAWLQRDMRDKSGAFYSSFDADSLDPHGHSEVGTFYVWQPIDVKTLLTPEEFTVASQCYGFDRAANFEDIAHHPYLVMQPLFDDVEHLKNAQVKLFAAREKRIKPGRDDKILTSWNALDIKGLARAGRVFNRPEWIVLAQNTVDFIHEKMWANGKLFATCKNDGHGHTGNNYRAHLNADSDDYAFLLDALIELLQADFRMADLNFAQELAEALLENFESEDGGFYFTSHSHEQLIHRSKQGFGNATPNGNGIAAVALRKLGHILGETNYLRATERTLKAFYSSMSSNPAACASLCHALNEFLLPPVMVKIKGEAEKMVERRNAINQTFYPHHLFLFLDEHIAHLPATLQRSVEQNVNVWVCKGVECAHSVNNLHDLKRLIYVLSL